MSAPSGPQRPAIVFAGGDPPPASVADHLAHDVLVIAADSGLEHALALGRDVDLVVGDFDSVDPQMLDRVEATGATVERHPVEKDATDLELALVAALSRGAPSITVVGGYGGRYDHLLANALVLASPRFEEVAIDAWIDTAHLTVVRDRTELCGAPGDLCTLLALGGPAQGITTTGLRYPLDDDQLLPGSTRGVSNELVDRVAMVTVRTGVVLAIQPHALEEG